MEIREGVIHGALIVLNEGDVLDRMTIIDTVIFSEGVGTITGCNLTNSVVHLTKESFGEYDPNKATRYEQVMP